jgi:hypothetical protein
MRSGTSDLCQQTGIAIAPLDSRKELGCKRPRDAETKVAVSAVGVLPAAVGGTKLVRIADPGTAAKDPALNLPARQPSRAVSWRVHIIGVENVLAPLPDITVNVE